MKAISIALIPKTTADLEWLIQTSAQIGDGETFLNSCNKLPHVTLAMGVIKEDAEPILVQEVKKWQSIQLETNTFSTVQREGKRDLIWLNIHQTPSLIAMHEQAMGLLKSDDKAVLPKHFKSPEELNGNEANYVESFEGNAFNQFQPHVTLGYGSAKGEAGQRTIQFRAGVFHLGPSCTCHTELT